MEVDPALADQRDGGCQGEGRGHEGGQIGDPRRERPEGRRRHFHNIVLQLRSDSLGLAPSRFAESVHILREDEALEPGPFSNDEPLRPEPSDPFRHRRPTRKSRGRDSVLRRGDGRDTRAAGFRGKVDEDALGSRVVALPSVLPPHHRPWPGFRYSQGQNRTFRSGRLNSKPSPSSIHSHFRVPLGDTGK